MLEPDNKKPFDEIKSLKQNSCFSRYARTSLAVLMAIFFSFASSAQEEKELSNETEDSSEMEEYKPFTFGAQIKNMHTWHGFVVHPGAMFATSLSYTTRDDKFTFGFWGGASFTTIDVFNDDLNQYAAAHYQEVSFHAMYKFTDRFYVDLWTHNNFTGVQERGDELHYWRYDKETTYNFPKLNFGYDFDRVSLYWGIILLGQAEDLVENEVTGELTNSWSQYASVKATLYEKGDTKLIGFVGGAWSPTTDHTFYTEGRGNIINVGTTLSQKVSFGEKFSLPVEGKLMWNPEKEITVLQLAIGIF